MSVAPAAPPFRLPVWETLGAALRETRGGFGIYLRLIRLPLAFWLTGAVLIPIAFADGLADMMGDQATIGARWLFILGAAALILFVYALLVPAVTAWHRYLILGPGHPAARVRYSIGKAEWKYVKAAIVVGVPWFVVTEMIEALLSEGLPVDDWVNKAVWQAVNLLVWLVIARWLLLFPAAAIGEPSEGYDTARMARGNTLRLWFVVMLPETVAWLAYYILYIALSSSDGASRTVAVANGFVTTAATFVFLPISVAALSISYRQIVDSKPFEVVP